MSNLVLRLPAAPLQRAIVKQKRFRGMSWEELADYLGISSRTVQRIMASRKIGLYCADHMAIRLGLHPSMLWPDEWQNVSDQQEQWPKTSLEEVV